MVKHILGFVLIYLSLLGCNPISAKLRNDINEMSYQCGQGYDPDKSYIKIQDPTQNGDRIRLVVLRAEDRSVTEKGCLERPQERIFVSNADRSAGIWVSPDSAKNLTLEIIGRVDLPTACNSLIHADGAGFTLNFDLKSSSSQREVQKLQVGLYHLKSGEEISSWEPKSLESANYFAFHKDKPILSGEYRLVAHIADEIRNVQSKSECTLRLDQSDLYISPADKISEKRNYNGQEVLIVQPGYSVNFYVHEGFRDVKIEYCLVPLTLDGIAPVMDRKYFECNNPVDFLQSKSESLDKGFWMLNYRGQRGAVETAWQHAIFLVEKTCAGVFESVASLRGLDCTLIRGNLTLNDLSEENQRELDAIGRITGSITIGKAPIKFLKAFPNLYEILGSLSIASDNLTSIEGFSSLSFVLDDITVRGNNLESIASFENLRYVTGNFTLANASQRLTIQPFKQLTTIEGALKFSKLKISSLAFLQSLRSTSEIFIDDLEIVDFSGLDSIESIGILKVWGPCRDLKSLNGMPNLKSLRSLELANLPLTSLTGLNRVEEIDHLYLDDLRYLSNLRLESGRRLRVSKSLRLVGDNAFADVTDIDFNSHLEQINIFSRSLQSLKGLEKVEQAGRVSLVSISATSLQGLESLQSVGDFTLMESPVSDISALGRLEHVTGNLEFEGNRLADLSGFKNLKTVGGDFILSRSISSLVGLPKSFVVRGRFVINDNRSLVDLEGLNSVKEIGKDFLIAGGSLQSLKGLEGLTIRGNVFIGYSYLDFRTELSLYELRDISPLVEIAQIGGGLRFNSPVCVPPEFMNLLKPKVLGQPSENTESIPDREASILIKQPEDCI